MRIIFLDIDGTIIDCFRGLEKPSLKTIESIKTLQAQGDAVLIVSGRPKCLLNKSILDLNTDGLILGNGSYIEYHGKQILCNTIDDEIIEKIIAFGTKHYCPYYLETNDYVYTQDKDSLLHHNYFDEWKLDDKVKNYDGVRRNYLACMMALRSDEKLMEECENYLAKDLDMARQNGLYAYDLNAHGFNKGSAIKYFINYLNYADIETYAFGDGENDITMMQNVDHPIAMGNACEKIKSICEYQTADVLDEGVNEGLKHYQVLE